MPSPRGALWRGDCDGRCAGRMVKKPIFAIFGGGAEFPSDSPSGRVPEQGRAKRGPRAAKSDPKGRPRDPQDRPRGCPGRQEPQKDPSEARNGCQERPKKTQGRPSIRQQRTPEQRSPCKKIQVETRQQMRRPEARGHQKLTKGVPEPVSPEPLGPYPTYFSCL